MNRQYFRNRLLKWFDSQGRMDLPWKHNMTPYRVWVSEIMLQQTQVVSVIDYYQKFMTRFPSLKQLAHANIDEVLVLWAGLGYYARARNLHKCAQVISSEHQGHFPNTLDALNALPGIGPSTAGAILAQAYNIRAPILDGNVKRVLSRALGIHGLMTAKTLKELWDVALDFTPHKRVADYTQAIMDFGAMVCTKRPKCELCPLQSRCYAFLHQAQAQIPAPKPKKAKPIKRTQFVQAHYQESILLQKRPAKGIWGGLWCFPESEELKNFKASSISTGHRHTFSHYHLDYEIANIRVSAKNAQSLIPKRGKWVKLAQLNDVALATPFKKLLEDTI